MEWQISRHRAFILEGGWRLDRGPRHSAHWLERLYELSGRRPYASINFITCHDGFTLQDLVSYNGKHNEANLKDNRDGTDDNRSWNCGVEGPTTDPVVLALRARQKRNFLATLFLSQGVPMLLAGDELGRTQNGNNNAYCQDDEINWMPWNPEKDDHELLAFVKELIKFEKAHPASAGAVSSAGRAPRISYG